MGKIRKISSICCMLNLTREWVKLTFTTLWANSADNSWQYFSYFSQKTGFDILCKYNLDEMSNPVSWEKYFSMSLPALVAQLDARPTGDQAVAGSTPTEVGNILSWRLIMKYFLWSSLPSPDSRRAVVSFWWKNVHNTGKPLRGLSLSSKHMVR